MLWNILLSVIVLIILLFLLYFILSGIVGLFTRNRSIEYMDRQRHFAVLIPARNEEWVIENLVRSLKKQNYPGNLLDIYVIINNSTDQTKELAVKAGARVICCKTEIHSKGEALKEAFSVLQNRNIEAYAVFDADNVVDPEFISEMNQEFNRGYQIVQGRRIGKNSEKNGITGVYELFYMMQNVFFNNARSLRNKSASVNGTGWGVTSEWITQYGFPVKTLTEDIELTIMAALHGENVGYANEARTYDEYPDTFHKIQKQLPRWIFGQIQCMRCYTKELFRTLKGNTPGFDMLMVLLMPFAAAALTLLLLITAFKCEISILTTWLHRYFWYILLVLYVIVLILEILEIRKSGLNIKIRVKSMLMFPIFLLIWLPVCDVTLFRRRCTWEKVVHDNSISIEEIK